jgi:ssDNA-binding Zn-finger/Zn-ribbon topoisomerase 1
MEQTITLATFNEAGPAEALKDRLIGAGLHGELIDDSGTQAIFFLSKEPRAHMKVHVHKEEYEQAKKLVQEWEKEGVMTQAVRCPQCGSSRIEYPQFSRRTAGSMFFALLSAAHLIPREYYCEDCQFTWPDKVIPDVDRDALNWPRKSKVP